jgi:hypothetical protein
MRSWIQRLFFKPSYEELSHECSTIRQVCKKVKRWITYKESVFTEPDILPGSVVWERGYGDCGHIASCIVDACKLVGRTASIRRIYTKDFKQGHAVAFGQVGNIFWVSSNGDYKEVKTLKDIDCVAADALEVSCNEVVGINV